MTAAEVEAANKIKEARKKQKEEKKNAKEQKTDATQKPAETATKKKKKPKQAGLGAGDQLTAEERMNEFLAVAKNLEIKELGSDVDVRESPELETGIKESIVEKEENIDKSNPSAIKSNIIANDSIKAFPIADVDQQSKQCPECGKEFTENRAMKRHHKSFHQGINYSCEQCDYKSKRKDKLTEHIKSKHEGVRLSM